MNKFQIFRYIKNLRYLIVLVTLMGCAMIFWYIDKNQVYTAEAVIKYTSTDAENGKTPTGTNLDPKEIYSAAVITDVISDLGLSANVDSIRSACKVEPVIPEEEQQRKAAVLDSGEKYEYNPTTFKVSFTANSKRSKGYVRNVLDAILRNYFIFYNEKYIDTSVVPNNNLNISTDNYDYISCVEMLDSSTSEISNYLNRKMGYYPNRRSSRTGYSFEDLYARYQLISEINIPKYYARIFGGKLTKDKEALVKLYQNRRDVYGLRVENLNDHIDKEREIVDQYGDKVTKSESSVAGAVGDNTDAIIENVEWHNGRDFFNTETTYDDLIDKYVGLRSERSVCTIDGEYCNYVLSVFNSDGVANDTDSDEVKSLVADLDKTLDELNSLYSIVVETSEELNEYSGAQNIATMASTYATEAIDTRLYIIMAFILFLVVGCAGAIFIGRMADFWDYFLYTDKKTGIANRAKCDLAIAEYSKKLLDEHFTFIALKLDSLAAANQKLGRRIGDETLKEFGTKIKAFAENYGFVGYNNGNMFFAMFENCTSARAEHFVELLRFELSGSAENNEENNAIKFMYGIAESTTDNVYDIRELLRLAIQRLH